MPIPQIEDIQYLALNYSKQQLASLARTGQINPQDAVMAGMMQDRIQKANAQPPSTTVAEDVLAPQMPQGVAGLPAQEAPVEEMPVGMEGGIDQAAGLEALPIPEDMYDEQSMAGGGIVAFEEGGNVAGIDALTGINSDLAKAVREREAVRKAYLGEDLATKDFIGQAKADLEKAKKREENSVYDAISMAGIEYARTGKLGEAGAAGFKQYFSGQEASKKEQRELQKELLAAAGLDRKERSEALSAAEKSEQSRKELASRERIAATPDKIERIAAQLRKDNPEMSYLESIDQASKATSPKDTYNATRQAITKAAEAVNEQIKSLSMFDPAFRESYQKYLAGTASPEEKKKVEATVNGIQRRVYEQFQVGGVDVSSGKMQPTPNAPATSAARPGATRGEVDRNNPLLK